MKKILSIALALTVLLSLAAVLAIPTAAVDGDWDVIPGAAEFQPDYADDPSSLSGYEYTDNGFHTIPATEAWQQGSPHVSVQTKNKVDLKEGVYFEVVIDNFTYSGDKWFNMHIWDSQGVSPGSNDPKIGSGVQELIRPGNSPDANDPTKPGSVSGVTGWYINQFTPAGSNTSFVAEQNQKTEDGKPILAMTVTWDGSTYALDINGGAAPQAVIDFMNQKWGGNDSEAYIGINCQNSIKAGTVEFTVTKFGTDKATATTPMGDDSREPTNENKPIAAIADESTVPANQPAVFMNMDRENSDLKNKIVPSNATYTINDDFSAHLVAEADGVTVGSFSVKNEVSYDIADFPICIAVTKNFCTCGNEDGSCDAFESASYYIMAGDVVAAANEWHTSVLDMSYSSYDITNSDGETDTYLYFFCDFADEFAEPLSGRINGVRFEVSGFDPSATDGSNTFDFMFLAFFRTVEEAEAYVLDYVTKLGWVEEEETTEEPTTAPETDKPEDSTAAPDDGEATTEAPVGDKGEATTEAPKADDKKDEGGCASVIGFSAIAAVVAVAAAGVVTFRKKRD